MDALPFDQALHLQAADILDRCTTCGACAGGLPDARARLASTHPTPRR